MIARLWRGWARDDAARSYGELLRKHVLPEFKRIQGFLGAYVFRQAAPGSETEFTVLTLFRDMDAVRAIAGEDGEQIFVPPEAQKLLSHYEPCANHYEIVTTPAQLQRDAWLQRMPQHRIGWNW
jgi:hypothetical protein